MNENRLVDQRRFTTTRRASRIYIHDKCGSATQVSGTELAQLSDPYSISPETVCVDCGRVSIASVRWAETDEPLDQYRARLRRFCPRWIAFLPLLLPVALSGLGYLFGVVAAMGIEVHNYLGLVCAGLGAVFGIVVGFLLRPLLFRMKLDVSFFEID